MNILTLQITADNFEAILKGSQKVETRLCDTPKLISRYFFVNDNGENEIRKYDALKLINGRKTSGTNPELTVEVVKTNWHDYYNEKGEQMTYEFEGDEYPYIGIEFNLGRVIEHKNTEKFFK